ncbi:MAG TPA: NAD(P)/FAD-dependent oxidoreductase [Actinomycetes bacterium]|nr:NAD(P)/FAD-dependent oxidoreductase [Actinomycetes bacterium]
MSRRYDAVIVGGGHNGLVAAAYLARAGLRTVVLESRPIVGGAAVSEHPWGPDYTVTSLSYVVSWLPPGLVKDLSLDRHGYHIYPQGPYFAPRLDGRALQLPSDPTRRREQISQFSQQDAIAFEKWEEWLDGLGRILGRMMADIPPKLGSRKPVDLVQQAKLLGLLKELDVKKSVDLARLLSSSISDLTEDWFTSDALQGVLAVSGVIGTWAGPRSPGTAYVMLHHHVGDLGDGKLGAWGFPRGGMGGVSNALAAAARSFGVEIRTESPVAEITVKNGVTTGVVLADGEQIDADVVVTTVHPQRAFLELVGAEHLPEDFVEEIQRWRTRSGSVKVNLAVDRLPEFTSRPGFDPEVHGGTIVLAESLDDIEFAFQDAVQGKAAERPFADICIPSVFDDSLAPEGQHIVSMFTQWVPHTWANDPHPEELESYADRLVQRVDAVAPGFTSSVLHRQVIGPDTMQEEYGLIGGNIFHGELTPGQMFHARPAAGYADLRTPVAGLYQAGSATHGGGGVTGIPGRNVVGQILRDRSRAKWLRRVRIKK